ncbi:MAG: cyclic nucleotide-binding domain-containing protein [Pseudomonadota bacterium]
MKTMTPLRVVAITSNVAFIAYGYIEGLLPILVLHLCLLPLNLVRLRQYSQLMAKTRESGHGEFSFESLVPFMTPQKFKAGEVVFHKGDPSNEMYYVCEGEIRLPELDKTIGERETLGEIGLFSPDKTRTVTAQCETDSLLLRISEERFLQLYNQNPRFGFQIVRVITSRLIENYQRLAQAGGLARESAEPKIQVAQMTSQIDKLDETRKTPDSKGKRRWASNPTYRVLVPTACFVLVFAIFFLSWTATPYVHSLLVRDAAVTTWSNVATAPIDGTITFSDLLVQETVAPDGVVATVQNEHLSRRDYDEAVIRVNFARLRIGELENFLEEIRSLDEERGLAKSQYADSFRAQLDTRVTNLESEIATLEEELGLIRKIASRKGQLADKGTLSENEADEARLRVSDLEVELSQLKSDLSHARVRQEAAKGSVFLTGDGTDPDWVFDSRIDLKMQKNQARLELRKAQAELEVAESALVAAEEDFRRLSKGPVAVPPGSVLWSRQVASGSTVRAGDPVAEWLNCSIILVDVPLADIEVPLINVGMEAKVLLDGETTAREGRVLLTRGSASTLGRTDLVAVASGRDADAAQVLVDISPERNEFGACPVGRSAFVDFPSIGLLEVLSAWLRL